MSILAFIGAKDDGDDGDNFLELYYVLMFCTVAAYYPALLPDFLRTVFHLCFMFILYFSLLATNQ